MSVSYGFWDAARVKRERGDGGYSTQLSDTAELAACGEGEPEVQSLQVRRRARSGRGGARRALRAATRGGADPARASGTAARTSVGALARLARAALRVSCNPRHLYPSAFGGACSIPGRALRCLGLRCALRRQCSCGACVCPGFHAPTRSARRCWSCRRPRSRLSRSFSRSPRRRRRCVARLPLAPAGRPRLSPTSRLRVPPAPRRARASRLLALRRASRAPRWLQSRSAAWCPA